MAKAPTSKRPDDRRGAPKGSSGNIPHERTDEMAEQIATMVGLGMVQEDIGLVLKISPDTMQRHYKPELAIGKAASGFKLRQRAYALAMGTGGKEDDKTSPDTIHRSATAMTMFLLKTQHGFKERVDHGFEGGNITVNITPDDDEL
jgi:hypothetical protein